jgi:hypothetical protein
VRRSLGANFFAFLIESLTKVVDVYISALRSKVDRDFPQKLIQTNRGVGYTFTCVRALVPPASGPTGRGIEAQLLIRQ